MKDLGNGSGKNTTGPGPAQDRPDLEAGLAQGNGTGSSNLGTDPEECDLGDGLGGFIRTRCLN
jgi:hypothetical protein